MKGMTHRSFLWGHDILCVARPSCPRGCLGQSRLVVFGLCCGESRPEFPLLLPQSIDTQRGGPLDARKT